MVGKQHSFFSLGYLAHLWPLWDLCQSAARTQARQPGVSGSLDFFSGVSYQGRWLAGALVFGCVAWAIDPTNALHPTSRPDARRNHPLLRLLLSTALHEHEPNLLQLRPYECSYTSILTPSILEIYDYSGNACAGFPEHAGQPVGSALQHTNVNININMLQQPCLQPHKLQRTNQTIS